MWPVSLHMLLCTHFCGENPRLAPTEADVAWSGDSPCLGKHTLRVGNYTRHSLMKLGIKRGAVIFEFFGICNRCCHKEPTSLGNVTPYFQEHSSIITACFFFLFRNFFKIFFIIKHGAQYSCFSDITCFVLNCNIIIVCCCFFLSSFNLSSSSSGCIVHCPLCPCCKQQAR